MAKRRVLVGLSHSAPAVRGVVAETLAPVHFWVRRVRLGSVIFEETGLCN